MNSNAIDVRGISRLLLDDAELMRRWKAASQEGKIEAVTRDGRNLALVADDDLMAYICQRYGSLVVTASGN